MPIPQQIKASVGLARLQHYEGAIDQAEMPRLMTALAGPSGPLQAKVELRRDHQGEWLRGSIDGVLSLECQRCFKSYPWSVNLKPALLLVDSDAAEQKALEFADPYRIENDQLPLHQMLEDEVLLALPIVPRCQDCEQKIEQAVAARPLPAEAGSAASQTTNPFAQLSKVLKNDSVDLGGAERPRRK